MARRMDRKGRSMGSLGRFFPLQHYMMDSIAWAELLPVHRAVYLEIARLFDGKNNGRLAISTRLLATRVKASKNTAARAIKALIEHGFIEQVKAGYFSVKVPHAAEYRLTAFKCHVTGALPSKAFASWTPEKQKPGTPQIQGGHVTGTDNLKAAGDMSQKDRHGIPSRTANAG